MSSCCVNTHIIERLVLLRKVRATPAMSSLSLLNWTHISTTHPSLLPSLVLCVFIPSSSTKNRPKASSEHNGAQSLAGQKHRPLKYNYVHLKKTKKNNMLQLRYLCAQNHTAKQHHYFLPYPWLMQVVEDMQGHTIAILNLRNKQMNISRQEEKATLMKTRSSELK